MFERMRKLSRQWDRFSIKHWRAWDITIIGIGIGFLVAGAFVGETGLLVCAVAGSFFLATGVVCYTYDRALTRTGCMEKVMREMQK